MHFRFLNVDSEQEASSTKVHRAVFYVYRSKRDSPPYEARLHRIEITCNCGHEFEGKPCRDEVVRCPCCRRGYACHAESTDAIDSHGSS